MFEKTPCRFQGFILLRKTYPDAGYAGSAIRIWLRVSGCRICISVTRIRRIRHPDTLAAYPASGIFRAYLPSRIPDGHQTYGNSSMNVPRYVCKVSRQFAFSVPRSETRCVKDAALTGFRTQFPMETTNRFLPGALLTRIPRKNGTGGQM